MTSKLDVLASIAARLGESRDSGKIKGDGDNLTNILISNETPKKFDIDIQMEKRATLIIHVIEIEADAGLYTAEESISFLWPHNPRYPMKPSYDAGDCPLSATFMYSKNTDLHTLFAAAHYLIDGWLADTNPAHMWTKRKKAKHPSATD